MPRKGTRRSWSFLESADIRGLVFLVRAYVEAQRVRGLSEMTIEKKEWTLFRFVEWCHERGITRPDEVTKPILERYQRTLYYHRRDDGSPLSFRSQYQLLASVKYLFRWLVRNNYAPANPAADLDFPRLGTQLPRNVLSVEEVEKVLAQPDLTTPYGVRDRAILETLYSTGVRRSELCSLKLYDVGFTRGTLMIRQGKGRKDRVVPIGQRAIAWIDRYVLAVRPQLVSPPDEGFLFIAYHGQPFNADYLGHEVRRYVEASGIGKEGACHLFRHTMATLMLEGGADIRYVQEMLGHAKLETTRIYTQVAIDKLKQIHTATHPGALIKRPAVAQEPAGDEDQGEASPATSSGREGQEVRKWDR
jgi:integrase/recombinase XerD